MEKIASTTVKWDLFGYVSAKFVNLPQRNYERNSCNLYSGSQYATIIFKNF